MPLRDAFSARWLIAPVSSGALATFGILAFYYAVVFFISGGAFAASQFAQFWYFIVTLAVGFGVQTGLYAYLRRAVRGQRVSIKAVATSGTTSTAAMISCCAHFLATAHFINPPFGVA